MQTATTKRLYKVVANGTETKAFHLGMANRIAKRTQKQGTACKVVEVK